MLANKLIQHFVILLPPNMKKGKESSKKRLRFYYQSNVILCKVKYSFMLSFVLAINLAYFVQLFIVLFYL
jgi:hypothetical protein